MSKNWGGGDGVQFIDFLTPWGLHYSVSVNIDTVEQWSCRYVSFIIAIFLAFGILGYEIVISGIWDSRV